ncbi:MAG: DMT family transporter [Planctomycetes bacterium]|nr:DMT family transporter [Planctomycetota bacterium]
MPPELIPEESGGPNQPSAGGDSHAQTPLPERPFRALGLVFLAGLAFASLSAAIKEVASEGTGLWVAILARGVVGLVVCLGYASWRGVGLRIRGRLPLVLRCTTGVVAMYCYYWAFTHGGTDLATAVVLLKTAPLWVALLAPVLLGERTGRILWLALLIGGFGVAIRYDASFSGERAGLLASLAAGILAAGAYMALRSLGRTDSTLSVVTWFSVALILFPLVGMAVGESGTRPWSEFSGRAWALLALIGVLGTLGQFFLTSAYAHGRAAAVTVGGLSEVLIALGYTVFWFGESVTLSAALGGGLALAGGVVASLGRRSVVEEGDEPDPRSGEEGNTEYQQRNNNGNRE